MSKIDRREFLFGVASAAALPMMLVLEARGQRKPGFSFVLPDNENVFAVGETVPLRIFTKSLYPRFQVNFKANGDLIGTASSFPYKVNWVPATTGDYVLTAEVSTPNSSAIASTNVKVFNLLYDAIGRRGTCLYDIENHYSSFNSTAVPEAASFGVPLNYNRTVNTAQRIRRIDVLISATSGITNVQTNIPFPTINFIQLRMWNNGEIGFQNAPRIANLYDINLLLPNTGSVVTPFVTNSVGIKYYLAGWANLNIPLPAGVPVGLSIHCGISSIFDFTEMINFARSTISAPNLFYARGSLISGPPTITGIGPSAIRLWTV